MRLLLFTAGIAIVLGVSAFGQAPTTNTFEVASVKPSPPVPASGGVYFGPPRGGPGTSDPGQITWTYATLKSLLMTAFDVKDYQISGPEWMARERYDVIVKVPEGTTKEQVGLMWQSLLTERFGMVLHRESREFQVEDLVVDKSGSKLKASADDPAAPVSAGPPQFGKNGGLSGPGLIVTITPGANGPVARAVARAQPISKLTSMMGNQIGRPVVDKTGLSGLYDFTLEFTPDLPGAPAASDGIGLIAAVQQQLGLRLAGGKATLDVVVVEKAERVPAAN